MSGFVERWTLSPLIYGGYYSKNKWPERRGPLTLVSERSRKTYGGSTNKHHETRIWTCVGSFQGNNSEGRPTRSHTMHEWTRLYQEPNNGILFTLQGRSTRKMLNMLVHGGQHTLKPKQDSDSPREVKRTSYDFIAGLHRREEQLTMPKPWMTTPSVVEVRERFGLNPFEWPQKATLTDF